MFPKAAAEQLELPWLSGAQVDAVKAQAKKLGLLVGSVDAVTLLLVKRNPMDELRKRKTAQLMKLSAEKLRARANKAVGSGWAGSSLELSTASAAAKEDIKSEAIRVLIQVEETKHQSGSFYRFKKDGTADGYFDTGTWSEHPTRDITSLHHPLTALSDIFRAQQATEHAGQAAAAEPNGQAAHRAEAAQHQGAAGRRCVFPPGWRRPPPQPFVWPIAEPPWIGCREARGHWPAGRGEGREESAGADDLADPAEAGSERGPAVHRRAGPGGIC